MRAPALAESFDVAPGFVRASFVMQIGQILVEQRWVEPAALARALAEQRHTGKRICSLLIARGLLDPDNAARALAIQHNVPGLLQRHLDNRDHALAALLPVEIARSCFALPIGRTGSGELIICVRDPRPELHGVFATAIGAPVVIAVAPASQLEQLVKQAYEGRMTRAQQTAEISFDVDLTTRQISTIHDEPAPAGGLGDLGSMTLVGLDDHGVDKDPTQTGPLNTAQARPMAGSAAAAARTRTGSSPPSRALPRATTPLSRAGAASPTLPRTTSANPALPRTMSSNPALPRTTSSNPALSRSARALPRLTAPPSPAALAAREPILITMLAAIEQATGLEAALDAAMGYAAVRFDHAVLFVISEGAALGDRGHGEPLTTEVIQAITIPLSAPSIVQVAHDTRELATESPVNAGLIQERLARTLGQPRAFAAVPIVVGARVAYVIAVGDRAAGAPPVAGDLVLLARALGAACQRLRPR